MACWISRQGRIAGLRLPDTYGRLYELGIADLLGRFTVDQISAMRRDLPVVEA